jgi:hypothetical protein
MERVACVIPGFRFANTGAVRGFDLALRLRSFVIS